MHQISQHHNQNGGARRLQAILASVLIGLIAPSPAQAGAAQQISVSPAQMQGSGIRTETALATVGAPAHAGDGGNGQHLSGTVVAPTDAVTMVSAVVSGVVQQIHVNSLQQVRPGSAIATLFSVQLMEMQREYLHLATQASLSQQKKERDESLYGEGIIALARLQESRAGAIGAAVAASERRHALRAAGPDDGALRKLLESNSLTPTVTVMAGARGTVLELLLAPGQRIEAGMPMARIGRDGPLWIEFQAARQQAAQVRIGDLLQLTGCGAARVIAISPQMNGANQSTLVRARQTVNDGCLKPNQFVEASHMGRAAPAGSVAVPAAALVRHGADDYVFVSNEQGFEAVRVSVTPGAAGKVWVAGKVKPGSAVAVSGLVALKGAWMGLGAEAPAALPVVKTGAGQ